MKNEIIELAVKFDEVGNPTKHTTFISRPKDITFMLVYECLSLLASIDNRTPNTEDIYQMCDLVTRIYGGQFDSDTLINGLESSSATYIIYEQIVNVAVGSGASQDSKVSKEVETTKVESWESAKDNMKKVYRDMAKQEGSNLDSLLSLPFFFVFDELNSQSKTKEKVNSMMDAFL